MYIYIYIYIYIHIYVYKEALAILKDGRGQAAATREEAPRQSSRASGQGEGGLR